MSSPATRQETETRRASLEMSAEAFRAAGHRLVDEIAEFLESIPSRPVVPAATAAEIRKQVGTGGLPQKGADPGQLLDEASRILFNGSLLSAHPRFWGYIYSCGSPLGALGDFLASAVNPNVGGWVLSPT
ncbi:MAG TPA: aspartate aminotransferase family protein, partial [Terriglobia bacterium]|nr:aspartate aminotransferase family protein [Terriglobia bacterium]